MLIRLSLVLQALPLHLRYDDVLFEHVINHVGFVESFCMLPAHYYNTFLL